jgi:FkbM family methyltransferase
MENRLRLSLVTPSLNQKEFLSQMLESVQVQTVSPREHLIFDAGSRDGSLELLREYEKRNQNVQIFHGVDNGQTNAINLGFKECTGDIVAWINTDDRYVSPGIFARIVELFDTHEDIDVIYGRGRFVNEKRKFLKDAFVHKNSSHMEERLINAVGILQPSLFMRRAVFESVGPLNESLNFCMDYEYWIRVAQSGHKFLFIDEVFSEAVLHQDSKTGGQRSAQLKETVQMCNERFGFSALEWIERLADMELTDADGILRQGDRRSTEFNQRVREHFHEFNGNKRTLAAIWSRAGCAEAARTIKYTQKHGPSYKLFVATAFDSRFFQAGLTLIARLHRISKPKVAILIYDLGLGTDELGILDNLKHVYVLKLPIGDTRWFDGYFTPQIYGFKSYIAWHAGIIAPDGTCVLWMDAGIALNRDIEPILELIRKDDVFFVNHDDVWPKAPFVNMTFTTDECVGGMKATHDELLAPHIRAGLFGYKVGGRYHSLFEEAYQYSRDPLVICGEKHPASERIDRANPGIDPVKSLLVNPQSRARLSQKDLRQLFGFLGHRHDQSIVSILAARYQAPVQSAIRFCARYKNSSEISKMNWKSSFQNTSAGSDFYIDASCPSSNAICAQHRGLIANHFGLKFDMNRKKRALVLGNGPSLKGFDFKRLDNFDVFGMNAAYRYWDKIGWYPQYYSCLDLVVGVSHRNEIIRLIEKSEEYGIQAFLLRDNLIKQIGLVRNRERVINFDLIQSGSELLSAPTITTGSHTAAWAAYFGYKEIYLLGVDCNYVELIDGVRRGQGTELILESAPENNPNYFFNDYQQPGDHYNIPNPDRDIHLESWREVAERLQNTDIKVLNSNLLSKVDAFDYCDIEDLLESDNVRISSRETVFFRNFILANQLVGSDTRKAILSINNPFPAELKLFENNGFEVYRSSGLTTFEEKGHINYLQIYSFETAIETLRGLPWVGHNPAVVECLYMSDDKDSDSLVKAVAEFLVLRGYTVYINQCRDEKWHREQNHGSRIFRFSSEVLADFSQSNIIAFLQPVSSSVIGRAAACLEIDARKRLTLIGIEFKYFSRGAGFDGERFNLTPSKGQDKVVVAYKCAISPNQRVSSTISFYIDSPCALKCTLCRDGSTPFEHETRTLDLAAGSHCIGIDHVFQKMHWGVRVQIGVTESSVAISKITITVCVGEKIAKTEQSEDETKPFITTVLPLESATVWGFYGRDDHAHWDETEAVAALFSSKWHGSLMIDVGAHFGSALAPFLKMGWRIFAFEPDNNNRVKLLERLDSHKNKLLVSVDTRCVSNKSQKGVPFFTSEQSTGISGLSAFHASHNEVGKVDVTTLTEFFQEKRITAVDFLKIDTEGHDLFVLQGFPWERGVPAVIECEFEDTKTVPLGYTFHDLARFLVDKGYTVYVSEWHPIICYGIQHDWRQLTRYPCELADPKGWGNLLAFRDPIDEKDLVAAVKKVLKRGNDEAIKSVAGMTERMEALPVKPLEDVGVSLREANRLFRDGDYAAAITMYLKLHELRQLQVYADNALFAARKLGMGSLASIDELRRSMWV